MSITDNPTYRFVDEDLEQYLFPSALHHKQVHYIDRCDGDAWKLDIVQLEESLSREEVVTLMHELEALLVFIDKLNRPELHRSTEPGEPEYAGIGGGL